MDAKQFDCVARAVGQGTARRRLLAGLLGAVLAGSLGRADAPAKGKRQHHRRHRVKAQDDTPKPDGLPCKKHAQCLSGHCCDFTQRKPGTCRACCDNTHCTLPQTCGGGGTPGVCGGCTPSCAGKCGGAPDGCSGACNGTCTAPETCGGGGTTGQCGCLPAGTCCGQDSAVCDVVCCTKGSTSSSTCAPGGECVSSFPGRSCLTDTDCVSGAVCRNGLCCGSTGFSLLLGMQCATECCSGACEPNTTTCT